MAITPIPPTTTGLPISGGGLSKPGGGAESFEKLIGKMVGGANAQQLAADKAIEQLASGQTDSIHNVVVSAAKADLSFRLILEIRNKLMESYQEIMRMQV